MTASYPLSASILGSLRQWIGTIEHDASADCWKVRSLVRHVGSAITPEKAINLLWEYNSEAFRHLPAAPREALVIDYGRACRASGYSIRTDKVRLDGMVIGTIQMRWGCMNDVFTITPAGKVVLGHRPEWLAREAGFRLVD